jgi:hypothetical protein
MNPLALASIITEADTHRNAVEVETIERHYNYFKTYVRYN